MRTVSTEGFQVCAPDLDHDFEIIDSTSWVRLSVFGHAPVECHVVNKEGELFPWFSADQWNEQCRVDSTVAGFSFRSERPFAVRMENAARGELVDPTPSQVHLEVARDPVEVAAQAALTAYIQKHRKRADPAVEIAELLDDLKNGDLDFDDLEHDEIPSPYEEMEPVEPVKNGPSSSSSETGDPDPEPDPEPAEPDPEPTST